jgi:wobble nucleotide-excising tRNase
LNFQHWDYQQTTTSFELSYAFNESLQEESMIEKIKIAKVATFGDSPEVMDGLSQFNYFYGPNGSGKTTLSRLIANPGDPRFSACELNWRNATPLEVLVYNRDFITKNFNNPSSEIKGIFTLGEKHADTIQQITDKNEEIRRLTEKVTNATTNLQGLDGSGGKLAELSALETHIKETIWTQKTEHDKRFRGALRGFLDSKEKFKTKVMQERISNSSNLLPLADLETKANTLFGSDPTEEAPVTLVDGTTLLSHESNPILHKRVLGKEDVDISAMIKQLNNSDWVRTGKSYYDVNGGICPFCQQSTSEGFAYSLNEYFDETFLADSKAIDDLISNYGTDADRLQQQLSTIILAPSQYLDVEKLKAEKELLDSRIVSNKQSLVQKKKEPSQIIDLESVSNTMASVTSLINQANQAIAGHNQMVKNLSRERATLVAQVWKYIIEVGLKAALADYDPKKSILDKTIKGIQESINSATNERRHRAEELRELEKSATSIKPTIDAINSILKSYGFRSFSLALASNGTHYKILRENGEDARISLSEGEKTFVTFLYFYHFLKGSDTESGITTDRVVVFDDPVSSLDSDILFIVSSLIRGVIDEARNNSGQVKQVFVLTHNVYFHKEVTFNNRKKGRSPNEETFWIIRKPEHLSRVEKQPTNPIKTSYELLWGEVKNQNRSKLTIQNTLRRILENYFKILGGMDLDDLCSKFEGKDRLIVNSLVSWTHDGSHFVNDDLYQTVDDGMVEGYLRVFRAIFEKAGHTAHYEMMMRNALVEASADKEAA